jgi:hypothetical protein
MKPRHTPQQGFSLIQVSIILAVAGVILVSMLPGGQTGSDSAKYELTRQRMLKVEEAMQAFMAKNLRRPCPADGALAVTASTFGNELISGNNCTGGALIADGSNNVWAVAGTVPTRTLGLPAEFALDGFGRRMMYVVDKRAAVTSSTTTANCQDLQQANLPGAIEIAEDYTNSQFIDRVMWALISYGKDGHGAFPPGGSAATARTNLSPADEATLYNAFNVPNTGPNAVYGAVITTTPAPESYVIRNGGRLVQKAPTATFDDLVWYKEDTKNTCCIGKNCKMGVRLNGASTGRNDGTSITPTPSGTALATGDVNGDKIADLIIGQPCYGAASTSACESTTSTPGRVYVLYGKKTGWPVYTSTQTLNTMLNGTTGFIINNNCAAAACNGVAATQWFGRSVSVGDTDNDGFDDILIGAGSNNALVFGGSSIASSINFSALITTGTPKGMVFVHGGGTGGGTVQMADINGDGIKDLNMTQGTTGNRAFKVFGRNTTLTNKNYPMAATTPPSRWTMASNMSSPDIISLTALQTTTPCTASNTGFTIGTNYSSMAAGDLNGDGLEDMVYGTTSTANNSFVVLGRPSDSTLTYGTNANTTPMVPTWQASVGAAFEGTTTAASTSVTSVSPTTTPPLSTGNPIRGTGVWPGTSFSATGATSTANTAAKTSGTYVMHISSAFGSTGATSTSGSPTLTGVTAATFSSAFGRTIMPGAIIFGSGIPNDTYVVSFNTAASTITMSRNATASNATFFPNFAVSRGTQTCMYNELFYRFEYAPASPAVTSTLGSLATGTAQAGAASSITLASGSSSINDTYTGMNIRITDGTGAGQVRSISAYNGTTKVATVSSSWSTQPDSTSTYVLGIVSNVPKSFRFTNSTASDSLLGKAIDFEDLNNDGYKDIVISSNRRVFIYIGRPNTSLAVAAGSIASTDLASAANTQIDLVTSRPAFITADTLGSSVHVTDFNNDGLKDILIGSPNTNPTDSVSGASRGANTGSVYVLFQPSTGWPASVTMFSPSWCNTDGLPTDSTKCMRIDSGATGDYMYRMESGDYNADGYTDLALAAPGGNSQGGVIYMLWGKDSRLFDARIDLRYAMP